MAIDARLLVLDEPTLGLDLIYRKQFYDALLNDDFDGTRTVVLATHQDDEVQHVLTDVRFIHHGRNVFDRSIDDIEARLHEVLVHPDRLAAARDLTPIAERPGVGHSDLIFEGEDRQRFTGLGDVRTPSVAGLFLAVVK